MRAKAFYYSCDLSYGLVRQDLYFCFVEATTQQNEEIDQRIYFDIYFEENVGMFNGVYQIPSMSYTLCCYYPFVILLHPPTNHKK